MFVKDFLLQWLHKTSAMACRTPRGNKCLQPIWTSLVSGKRLCIETGSVLCQMVLSVTDIKMSNRYGSFDAHIAIFDGIYVIW